MSVLEGGYGLMHFAMVTALMPAFEPGNPPKNTNQPAKIAGGLATTLSVGNYLVSGCDRVHFPAMVDPFRATPLGLAWR
jgi:hypothetical protein